MPYRSIKWHASRYRSRNRSRRSYGKYAAGAAAGATLAYAAYRGVKKLKEKINTEFKSVTSNYGLADIGNIDSNCEKHFLTGIAVGDTSATRDGRQVRCKGITVHGNIQLNQTTQSTNPPTNIRMIFFQQKSCCGSTIPTLDQLLDDTAGAYVNDFYNLDNVPINYRILKDKTWNLSRVKNDSFHFNFHFKMNSVMRYDGNSTTYEDQATNAVFCYIVSDVGSNLPDGNMSVRVRYVDN